MKLISGWRKKRKLKKEADLRKLYRKDYAKKLHEKVVEFEKEKELYKYEFQKDKETYILEYHKEKENLHEHYKKEIDVVRDQTDNKWRPLLENRDIEIDKLRKDKENRREAIDKFEQMKQDFETTFTLTRIKTMASGELIQKANQSLLSGADEWERFVLDYNRTFPKIQDKLKEK